MRMFLLPENQTILNLNKRCPAPTRRALSTARPKTTHRLLPLNRGLNFSTRSNTIITNNTTDHLRLEGEAVNNIILQHLRRPNREQRMPDPAPTHPLLEAAKQTMLSLWAARTWSARASLWNRLHQFAFQQQISHWPVGMIATAFLSSLRNIQASTRHSYAKSLAALAHRLGHSTPLLDLYIASLRKGTDMTPTRQAVPASKSQVEFLVKQALLQGNNHLAAAIFVCFKTASRWDDVLHLKKKSLIEHIPRDSIVLEWGKTKTSHTEPFRVSGWTVLVETNFRDFLDDVAATFRALPNDEAPLIATTTTQLTRWMQQFRQTATLTGHSFKRGATAVLVHQCLQGNLDARLIPLMLKHKDALHEFPVSTLRYAPNKAELARVFGTQNATRLL